MKRDQIDSIGQLDLEHLTAADLKWEFATGRSLSFGHGRDKVHSYRNGVQTPIGDIKLSVWLEAARYLIKRNGLEEELEHLNNYLGEISARAQLTRDLDLGRRMDTCLSGLYRDPVWVGFIPYNQKYHPELLEGVPMATIIPDCCQTECMIPKAQIRDESGTAPCPVCGRWAPFRFVPNRQ